MVDRISTSSAYQAVLNNLIASELAQSVAGNQLSSTEKATDLSGYGASAETLTALQQSNTQVAGFIANAQTVTAKLSVQDSALNEVADSANAAIQAVTQALAQGDGTALIQALQNAFGLAVEGLNATFNGEYLFAGGQVATPPVSALSLSALGAAPSIASVFHNDQRQVTAQVNQYTTISTGFLADQVGSPLFAAYQAIQQFDQGPNGPFNGTLTAAQKTFLTNELTTLNTIHTNLTNTAGQNGLLQSEVTSAQNDLSQRQTLLGGLIGKQTAADVAKASADLQQAQLSIQAAGQVFQALKSSSLLNSLSSQTIA
jgi:flagellar hook-associated protein 3 FlgL